MRLQTAPVFAFLFAAAFLGTVVQLQQTNRVERPDPSGTRVVIKAPLQILMYAGDRFLGANLEAIRNVSAGTDTGEGDLAYRIRAHRVVAQLNPCHEDNYYLGNALLSWGGAQDEGNDLLRRATECRHWDEVPPYFYGVNLLFQRDVQGAIEMLETAARRSKTNAAALRKFAIMVAVGEIDDDRAALAYLRRQTDSATDPKLKAMLEKRVRRLEGLIALKEAQAEYERLHGQPLPRPEELTAAGILADFPADPLRIGYEFVDGAFRLRQLKISGLERRQ